MAMFFRFRTFADMVAYVRDTVETSGDWDIEANIYTDEEIWYRPQLTLFCNETGRVDHLRWFAYDDEPTETKFMGKGSRVAARRKAESLVKIAKEVVGL